MAKVQKPDLDEATLQIAKRMLNTPPKPHSEMKVGKREAKANTAVDAAVKSGPKHRKLSQKEAAIRPPKSPTYAEEMIVCGVEKRNGKWRRFEPYCLFPDGRIESLNLSSSG